MSHFTIQNLQNAIKNQDIFLVYQPIVDLNTLEAVAFEALARWKFEGQYISPLEFTRVDDSDVRRSLNNGIFSLAEKGQKQLDKPVHVNISPLDLSMDRKFDIACIEITEEASKRNKVDVINKIAENYEIAVDDFGQDYASWLNLPYLDISQLKLDKAIADKLVSDKRSWYIFVVVFIVAMAKMQGIKIIAEGIETQEQLDTLKSIGVKYGQGYFIGRPGELNAIKQTINPSINNP